MDIHQLIYSSQPFGYDEATLAGILLDARRLNAAHAVTGALICRRDVYLQLLEGPERAVHATYDRISRDDRHVDLRLHASGIVPERLFGAWSMLHDPARSWLWSEAEVAGGAVESAEPSDMRNVFLRLADRVKTGTI